MATLTEQMQGLAADILSSRETRTGDLSAIRDELSTLREEITELRAQNEAWVEDNRASVEALREQVEEMRDRNRAWIEDNRASVDDLKEEVRDMLKELGTDLLGARRAWQGMAPRAAARRGGDGSIGAKVTSARRPKTRARSQAKRARTR